MLVFATAAAAAQDYSSPRTALKTLVDAYTAKDLDAAMAAKDFRYEAEDMLAALAHKNGSEPQPDEELTTKLEEVLRLSFRQQMLEQGFPDFSQYHCAIAEETAVSDHLVKLIEECVRKADGDRTQQTLHAFKRANEWKIVTIVGSY